MAPSRRKFVNTGKLNKATKEITQANATESPFFSRLSPEIRNRIYELVLGGYHLHVESTSKDHSQVYLCEAAQTDINLAKSITEDHFQPELSAPFKHHEKCHEARRSKKRDKSRYGAPAKTEAAGQLSLSILLVSRQIHQEAALIPFTKNTFLFSVWASPLSFLRDLLNRPCRAIANVVIYQECWLGPKFTLAPVILPKLPGLKRVTILSKIGISKSNGLSTGAIRPSPPLRQFEDTLKEIQRALHGREIVRLAIDLVGIPDKSIDPHVVQKQLEPFYARAREAETVIMQSRGEES